MIQSIPKEESSEVKFSKIVYECNLGLKRFVDVIDYVD